MSSLTELQKSMLEVGECLGVDLQDRRNIITFDDFRDVLHISNIKYSVYPNCIENRYLIEYELSNNIIRVVRETNVNKDSKLITNPFDEEQAYSYYVDNVQDIKEYKIKDNRMEVSQIEVSQKAKEDTMGDSDYYIVHFMSIKDVDRARKEGILSGVILKRHVDIFDLPNDYKITDGIEPFMLEKGQAKKIVK